MDRKNWIRKKTRLKNKLRKSNCEHRLIVFRSNRHIYGQVLDVENGKIILSSSSNDNDFSKSKKAAKANKIEASKIAAKTLSEKMKKNKISKIVFDRNGYIYHGRVKAFAEELRENGINF